MNRRHFLAGSMAMAAFPDLYQALDNVSTTASDQKSPQNLLATTFPESLLANRLLPVNAWHPYPHGRERAAWEAIPAEIRTFLLQRGVAAQSAGWKVLTATGFLDYKRTGNRDRYEHQEFGRRSQLASLVIAECLEGKGRFLDSITDGIWLICEESFWGVPAHLPVPGLPDVTHPIVELFGAETGALLAWTSYLLADQLETISPRITARIRLEAKQRLLQPARERDDFWWMGLGPQTVHLNNWNPWINSNLLVTNFLLEDDPQIRLQETVRITKSLDAFLNQYSPDGGCEEGPGYWAVSPACYFECVNTLQSATGNASDIFSNSFLDRMGRYIANVHIAKNYYVDFGDAHPKENPPGDLIYRYGEAVGDAQLAAFGAYCANKTGSVAIHSDFTSLSRVLPALFNAAKLKTAHPQDALIRDVWYPNLGFMAAREKAGSAQGMYLAVQAASNGRSHGHNDSGSFILYHDGEPVVIDVGVGTYTAATFSAERYSIWTMQSAYHNLPIVGGVMQHQGNTYRAKVIDYSSTDDRAVLSLDLAGAYPKEAGIKVWKRKLTLDRTRGSVLLEEAFELTSSLPVSLTIMTPGAPSAGPGGTLLLRSISGSDTPVSLAYDDSQIQPVIEKIALTDLEMQTAWGNEIYRLRLHSKQPVAQGNWSFEFRK